MRPFLPFATLLGAVFLLGCQDLGPTTPEAQPTVALSIVPAAISASGTVISINLAEKHGVIERTDDDSNTLYQFNIRDVITGGVAELGGRATFTIDPENSRHAIFVSWFCIDETLPPCDA